MSGIEIAGAILLILASALLTVLVMMQDDKSDGMGAIMGGSSSDSYLGKNRGRTLDAILGRWTKVVAIVFFVLVLAVDISLIFIK